MKGEKPHSQIVGARNICCYLQQRNKEYRRADPKVTIFIMKCIQLYCVLYQSVISCLETECTILSGEKGGGGEGGILCSIHCFVLACIGVN